MEGEETRKPRRSAVEKVLLLAILCLQAAILWRMFRVGDGALPVDRRGSPQPAPAGPFSSEAPPSLEPSVTVRAPSPFLHPDAGDWEWGWPSPWGRGGEELFMRRARALLESVERAGSAEWRVRPSWRMAQGDDAYWLTMDGVGEGDVSVQLDGRLLRLGVDRREAGGRFQMASQFLLPGEVAAGARPEVREEGGRVVIRIEKPVRGRRAEEAAPPDTEPGERDER